MSELKDLVWVGNSLKELREFPEDTKNDVGFNVPNVVENSTGIPAIGTRLLSFGIAVIVVTDTPSAII